MRILFILSGSPQKASSRVRGYWIAEALEQNGHEVTCIHVTHRNENFRVARLILQHDVIVFQKVYGRYEPLLLRWAKILGKKVFFDIDDAPSRTLNSRVERVAKTMMRLSDGVLAGSTSLMRLSQEFQSNVHLIPSGIRLASYTKRMVRSEDQPLCLGWIGNGAHYADDLKEILLPALEELAQSHCFRLRIVGACGDPRIHDTFSTIEKFQTELIDTIDWANPDAVSAEISQFDIGLYPLNPGPFNDFKCGFKALEYMTMCIPVLASNAANHSEIIAHDKSGLILEDLADWKNGLKRLASDRDLRRDMGVAGRRIVEERFSTKRIALQLEEVFLSD